MDGQIFSVDVPMTIAGPAHMTATLAELREFWVPVPPARQGRAADTAAVVLRDCYTAARKWCEAMGIEADIEPFTDDERTGVRVTLIIGRADGDDPADVAADNERGAWRWSSRWVHWADKLAVLRRMAYAPAGDDQATVIDFGARLAMREHQATSGPLG